MRINILTALLILTFSNNAKFSFSQEKVTPDVFNGFRDFEFYTPITDYYNFKYKLVKTYKNTSTYEIILPTGDNSFLGTQIDKVLISVYKTKIFDITLFLKEDINETLSNMFKDIPNNNVDDNKIYPRPYSEQEWREQFDPEYQKTFQLAWIEPKIDTIWYKSLDFKGLNTTIDYGPIKILKITAKEKELGKYYWRHSGGYYFEYEALYRGFCLSLYANDFESKIDTERVQEHYDSYLSDFGVKHYPKASETKTVYRIPLFEMGNVFYIRALFGDVVENVIFDTGSDQFVISKSLYNTLKSKNLLTEDGSTMQLVLANGELVNLKKVMLKNVQLYDLKIEFIEAYVNTSDDISLLGQSFFKRFGSISIDNKLNVLIIKK